MVQRGKVVPRGLPVSLFDIRIGTNEKDVIVITPSELETSPTLVRGKVVLSLSDCLAVRNITLRMYGVASVAWVDRNASNRTPPTRSSQKQTRTIFDKEWSFLPQSHSTFTLREGNYEYPFEVWLPDDIPDSVEGLPGGAIIYKMKATVERTGLGNKNITCRKHIRVVRTMSPTSFEFLQSQVDLIILFGTVAEKQSIENLWPNKCQYTIEIPTTAHIIGSQIPYHIYMIPHVKGLSICRIDVELKEHYAFAVLDSKNALIAEKRMERSIKIASADAIPTDNDEWNVHGYIEVPNSLDRCTQDCDAHSIKVKHRIKFVIGLRNADGHVSEIRASLPVALVLPPYISSSGITPHLDDSTFNHLLFLEGSDVLPSYESRIYDRLWDGVSYGGLDTSAANTPIAISQRSSAENLREMNRLTMPHPSDLEVSLHRALQERSVEEPEHDHSSEGLYAHGSASGSTTPTHSAPMMRPQNSQQSTGALEITPLNGDDEERNHLTPPSSPEMHHLSLTTSNNSSSTASMSATEEYIDMGRLSQVPSYTTANSSVLNLDPIINALPTYASATANPSMIPEQPLSRLESIPSTHSASRSPESSVRQPRRTALVPSSRDIANGFLNVGKNGSVYGAPQTFDDSMRRISLVRSLFASRENCRHFM